MYDSGIDYKAIGRRIREARQKAGKVQEEVALDVGVTAATISHIEAGSQFSFATLIKIANALNMSLDEIVCDNLVAAQPVFKAEIAKELQDCTSEELSGILSIIKSVKRITRGKRKAGA